MYKLQCLNVIRVVETEEEQQRLLNEGFIEVQDVIENADNVKKPIKKVKD